VFVQPLIDSWTDALYQLLLPDIDPEGEPEREAIRAKIREEEKERRRLRDEQVRQERAAAKALEKQRRKRLREGSAESGEVGTEESAAQGAGDNTSSQQQQQQQIENADDVTDGGTRRRRHGGPPAPAWTTRLVPVVAEPPGLHPSVLVYLVAEEIARSREADMTLPPPPKPAADFITSPSCGRIIDEHRRLLLDEVLRQVKECWRAITPAYVWRPPSEKVQAAHPTAQQPDEVPVLGDDLAGLAALQGTGAASPGEALLTVAQEILDRFPVILSLQWRNTLDTRAVRGARHLVRGRDLKRAMLVGGPALGSVVLSREAPAIELRDDLRADWPNCDPTRWIVDVTLVRNPIFVIGRYCKYRRDISQTPWDVGKARMDVESCIGPELVRRTGARTVLFSSAGREDCNVRMLGSGRPFAMELKGVRSCRPLLPGALRELEAELNARFAGDVSFSHLQVGSRSDVKKFMLDGASDRTKSYRALIRLLDAPVTDDDAAFRITEPIVIHQSTPLRVAHRRALLRRPKTIFELECARVGPDLLAVQLTTQGGTYIKEFVHGDFGRSSPSLPDLLPGPATRADLLLLDVTHVDCEYDLLMEEEKTQ